MDELAQQDHTYRLSKEEFKEHKDSGISAVSIKNRLHRESGEEVVDSSSNDFWWNWDTSKSCWISWEVNSFFQLFVAVGFIYSW